MTEEVPNVGRSESMRTSTGRVESRSVCCVGSYILFAGQIAEVMKWEEREGTGDNLKQAELLLTVTTTSFSSSSSFTLSSVQSGAPSTSLLSCSSHSSPISPSQVKCRIQMAQEV
jgi:hypothetical protein